MLQTLLCQYEEELTAFYRVSFSVCAPSLSPPFPLLPAAAAVPMLSCPTAPFTCPHPHLAFLLPTK